MLFNSIDLSPYFRIKDIRGRGLSRRIVNGISVPGMDGEHFSSVETPGKYLEVEIRISSENLRETIDKLNGILATDDPVPIVFPDEPDKTYYGMAEASEEGRERVHLGTHDAMIVIRRSDPYKYGPEHSQLLTADTTLIENPGSVEAYPVFEMEVLEPVTFAMVSNGEEYNLIGKPVEEEGNEEIVDEKVSVLYENGSTVDEWEISSPDHVDEHANDIDGRMVGDSGVGIRADSYGTGNRMHGPAITRELPEAIQDFEISSVFDIISRREIENFRMEIYFHDENM
ncbi:distal tail protein Dit, partial [Virgibacillus kimchii]